MASLTDLQDGDRVRVTRTTPGHGSTVWEGTISRISPNGGFHLNGIHVATGAEDHSCYSDAETLLRMYGCVQTVELLERPGELAACEHGSPARFVTVVDRSRKAAGDPYGDVEGPISVAYADVMRRLRDARAAETEVTGQFVLAFLHADRCRVER